MFLHNFIVAFLIIIIHTEPCDGALLSVGKLVCDENALCYQNDGAFTCVCKDTYSGDGWAAGAGCIEGDNYNKIAFKLIIIILIMVIGLSGVQFGL